MNGLESPRQPSTPVGGMTRRRALGYGGLACAGFVGSGSLLKRVLEFFGSSEASAGIFKGGAPSPEVWDQWNRRGWVKPARHWLPLGRNAQCKVCPNNCLLEPGDRSHCRNKVNWDGTLYTMAYGNPCTFHVDPIEKKPLFHFLPGSATFSLATSGCVFRCLNCQNWEISQKQPEETKDPGGLPFRLQPPLPPTITLSELRRLSLFPEDVAAVAKALGCPSVAYTYSEPTAYYEYALDTCKQAHEHALMNVLVTCGSIEERPFRDLAAHVDAAHVDLKGYDDAVYQKLNSGRLQPILNTLKIYRELGIWLEVINLIVPTYTDDLEMIRRMCAWFAANLGPDTPLHFSRFHPQHQLTHLPPTPVDTLVRAREIARAEGLHYVYLGNVHGFAEGETTFCPNCRKAVVTRQGYAITGMALQDRKCGFCGTAIAGVWNI